MTNKVTPSTVYRFMAAIVLGGYFYVTENPTSRSINVYYGEVFPQTTFFFDTIFPAMFVVGIIIVNLFGKHYPYRAMMVALIPQFIYMALSSGWVLSTVGTDNPTNPVALFTHVSMSCMWIAILWRELVYYDSPN